MTELKQHILLAALLVGVAFMAYVVYIELQGVGFR